MIILRYLMKNKEFDEDKKMIIERFIQRIIIEI